MAEGEWRTVRNPSAPREVHTALAYLMSEAATLARGGQGGRAVAMRQALDVVGDFVRFEPRDDPPRIASYTPPPEAP